MDTGFQVSYITKRVREQLAPGQQYMTIVIVAMQGDSETDL